MHTDVRTIYLSSHWAAVHKLNNLRRHFGWKHITALRWDPNQVFNTGIDSSISTLLNFLHGGLNINSVSEPDFQWQSYQRSLNLLLSTKERCVQYFVSGSVWVSNIIGVHTSLSELNTRKVDTFWDMRQHQRLYFYLAKSWFLIWIQLVSPPQPPSFLPAADHLFW